MSSAHGPAAIDGRPRRRRPAVHGAAAPDWFRKAEEPPQDLPAEVDALSLLLRFPDRFGEAAHLPGDTFFDHRHGRVFGAMRALHAAGKFPDATAVLAWLDANGGLDDPFRVYVQQLPENLLTAVTLNQKLDRLAEVGAKRRLWYALHEAAAMIRRGAPLADVEDRLRDHVAGAPDGAAEGGPVLTCLADVEPRQVRWLWPGRVPLGRLTVLSGRPGEGKSFATIDFASRVTTGTPWPDGSPCPKGSVVFITAEDDPEDTIRPRLDACLGDPTRFHLLSAVRCKADGKSVERMVTLADLPAIEAALTQVRDCKLLVVDPIGSFIGGKTDGHRDNEVRSVLAPVAALAQKHGTAVLVVMHRRKGGSNVADDTALGSRAFTGIARATWHLLRSPDDKRVRLLLPGKNNLAPGGTGLAFRIAGDPARVVWEADPVELTADDAMAAEHRDRKPGPAADAQEEAAEWLKSVLAAGPRRARDLFTEWENQGGSVTTLRRAQKDLGIAPYHPAIPGPWWWELPPSKVADAPHGGDLGHLDHLEENAGESADSEPQDSKVAKFRPLGHVGSEGALGGGETAQDLFEGQGNCPPPPL